MTEKDIRRIFQPGNVFGSKAFQKLIDFIVSHSGSGSGGSAFEDYTEGGGTKTKEEFLPAFVESVDNSELFFVLPEGTQLPYTLTEEDKVKLNTARFLLYTTAARNQYIFTRGSSNNGITNNWITITDPSNLYTCTVTETTISSPIHRRIVPEAILYTEQDLTDEKKLQARTNIGAEKATIVENIEGAEVTLDVKGGRKYMCGELTSLTINSIEKSADTTVIYFTSGATKTQFIYPQNTPISGWDEPEENKVYTICVFNGNLSIEPYE